jgi:hypothetical protein
MVKTSESKPKLIVGEQQTAIFEIPRLRGGVKKLA